MELKTYLRDEILEEAHYGYLSREETQRRLTIFDGASHAELANGRWTLSNLNDGPDPTVGDPEVWVGESDSTVNTATLRIGHGADAIDLYVARPSGTDVAPGVLVIHENRGLTAYIRDVVRRLANEGFVALAPDLLTPVGGTTSFADHVDATAALGTLDRQHMIQQLQASLTALAEIETVDPARLGVIGFCFGGGMTWQLVTTDARLSAAVPFYGINPPLGVVANISAAVLAIYGALDERINAGIPAIVEAMNNDHKTFEHVIYPNSQHAFHNDTFVERYNAETAKLAWGRATGWLHRYLE